MPKSTGSKPRRKRDKPYEGFPMFAHPSGQWAKKINKRLHYFGVWAGPEAALARLNREYPYLKEGKAPPAVDVANGCRLRQTCNDFLRSKEDKLKADDLSPRPSRSRRSDRERTLLPHYGRSSSGPKDRSASPS